MVKSMDAPNVYLGVTVAQAGSLLRLNPICQRWRQIYQINRKSTTPSVVASRAKTRANSKRALITLIM